MRKEQDKKTTRNRVSEINEISPTSSKARVEHWYKLSCKHHGLFASLASQTVVEGEDAVIDAMIKNPGLLQQILFDAQFCAKILEDFLLPMLTYANHPETVLAEDIKQPAKIFHIKKAEKEK
jgi:hypothetical protein